MLRTSAETRLLPSANVTGTSKALVLMVTQGTTNILLTYTCASAPAVADPRTVSAGIFVRKLLTGCVMVGAGGGANAIFTVLLV